MTAHLPAIAHHHLTDTNASKVGCPIPPRSARIVALAATLLAVAGCSSGTSENTPTTTSVPTQAAPAPNPGNYPTKPHPVGTAGSAAAGAMAEAHRMGDSVILPFQADPAITDGGLKEGPFTDPKKLSNWFDPPILDAVTAHHFIAGFLSSATTTEPEATGHPREKELMNTVLRFGSDADAAAAAADMASHSITLPPPQFGGGNGAPRHTARLHIARHPETAAYTFTSVQGVPIGFAYTAHGPYVLAQYGAVVAGRQGLADLLAAILDQQQPAIDAFTSTPVDQLPTLPLDPSGLLARTLPPDKQQLTPPGDYGPHAVLTFMTSPPRTQDTFAAAGVDAATLSKTNVYRARDAAGATKVTSDFLDEMRAGGWTQAPPVPAVPASACLNRKTDPQSLKPNMHFTYCTFSVGRFAVEAQGPQRGDVEQAAAAQYLMLSAP